MVAPRGKSFGGFLANRPKTALLMRREGLIHRENLTTCMTGITLNYDKGRLAQLVRAFGLHPKCRWFESGSAHQFKRGCCKTSSRPKGDICGNPALQGGGRRPRKSIRLEDGTRLEDATSLDCDSSPSSVFQTGFLIMLASSPALKSGVTIDDAFQAFFLIFHQGRNKTKCFATVPFFAFRIHFSLLYFFIKLL